MTIASARSTMSAESPARGIDRRRLLKVGAWSAPVLIAAVAVPAAVASVAPLDDIVFSQAYVQDTNNGSFSIYLAVRTTASAAFAATVTITPTGALNAPFTGSYKFTGGLQSAGLNNKAAGAPLGYAGSIMLGAQDKQGKIEMEYVKATFKGTPQSVTITVSATGHATKAQVLSAPLNA